MTFPLKPPGQCCSNFMQSLLGQENERLLKWAWSIDQNGCHAHIMLPHAFVWAIYIYIESIQVNCRSTVVKIVLIGNLRWPSSCLYLLYFSATVLFTCIKSWFFRIHLANFHQISHWSYCWNVIDGLFKWSCSIDCQAHIFFFKTKNCSNDDLFISCDDRIGKMLHNICMSAVTQVSEPWPVGLLFPYISI